MHALWGEALLRFLPGERHICDDGARQENGPRGNGSQFGPQIASYFALKTGQCPAQGFFAKVNAWFHWPASNISAPEGFHVEVDLCRDRCWSQPGQPNGLRWFVTLKMDAGSHYIIRDIAAFLFMQVLPAFKWHLAKVIIFHLEYFIWVSSGIWLFEGKAFAVYSGTTTFSTWRGWRVIEHPVAAQT